MQEARCGTFELCEHSEGEDGVEGMDQQVSGRFQDLLPLIVYIYTLFVSRPFSCTLSKKVVFPPKQIAI